MSESTISEEDARAKAASAVQAKTWHYFLRPNPTNAAAFANEPPPQGAGEAVFSVRENGQTDTFLFF